MPTLETVEGCHMLRLHDRTADWMSGMNEHTRTLAGIPLQDRRAAAQSERSLFAMHPSFPTPRLC